MIDIETLDTRPTAVILSIGVVPFDIETGEVSPDTYYVSLDHFGQEKNGRTVSLETVLWWSQQDDYVRCTALAGGERLSDALFQVEEFIIRHSVHRRRVWANSPHFDLGILNHAMKYDVPWEFWNERDVRTYCNISEPVRDMISELKLKSTHHPIDDCLVQIEKVCAVHWMINQNGHDLQR